MAGCGSATTGEVYLGKCYARFWSNGGGFASSDAVHGERLFLAVAGGFFASVVYFSLVLA
jgi:hypothetical protein